MFVKADFKTTTDAERKTLKASALLRDKSSVMRGHFPEYLMEAAGLGLFMISACLFGIVLSHHASPVVQWIPSETLRRVIMGLAMGSTAIGLIYSPWGQQSGAHFNPAVTLTFLILGKVRPGDAFWYMLFQVGGGVTGVLLVAAFGRMLLSDPAVNYVATVPGPAGAGIAWLVEFLISGVLMFVVLCVSNAPKLARLTGIAAGMLVALNITLAGPWSGMSMNPARTLASAIPSGTWTALWVYFTAPPLAMLFAAQCYLWLRGARAVFCAKLHHQNNRRCIFCEGRSH